MDEECEICHDVMTYGMQSCQKCGTKLCRVCATVHDCRGEFEKLLKPFRPMQNAGIYDPMEQAGHRDTVYISDVLKAFEKVGGEFKEATSMQDYLILVKRWFSKNAKM